MKLSTKGRYGLMAMYRLMIENDSGPISLKSIASVENLSEAYLEQLFASLKKNDLVKSVRGAQGGYMLSRDPEDISIGEIIRALEGDVKLSECCNIEDAIVCDRSDNCPTKNVLTILQDKIDHVIDSISLADMHE